jgi:hypothetical protein
VDSVADSIAKKDIKAACHLRILVVALFLFMSIFVPIVIFITSRNNEEEGFQSEFEALATKVIDSFEFNVARKFGAIDSLDISVTSYAVGTGSTPPNVTMPDFDLRAANTLALADTFSVFYVPVVEEGGRKEWEQYAVEKQGWIETAVSRETASSARRVQELQGIAETIFKFGDNGEPVPEGDLGPYFPIWQNAPVFEQIVNFNLLSVDSFRDGILAMKESEEAVLGRVAEFSDNEEMIHVFFDNLLAAEEAEYRVEPVSNLFYPVFDQFGSNATLVSLFSMLIFWHTFFEGVSLSCWLPHFNRKPNPEISDRSPIICSYCNHRSSPLIPKELSASLRTNVDRALPTRSMVRRQSSRVMVISMIRLSIVSLVPTKLTRFSNPKVLPFVRLRFP